MVSDVLRERPHDFAGAGMSFQFKLERHGSRIIWVRPTAEAEVAGQDVRTGAAGGIHGVHAMNAAHASHADKMVHENAAHTTVPPGRINRGGAVAACAVLIDAIASRADYRVLAVLADQGDDAELAFIVDIGQLGC